MSGLIERAKAAIGKGRIVWDDGCGNVIIDWDGIVRDVIASMREPTEAMLAAGDDTCDCGNGPERAKIAWRDMIDAALKEPT